MSRVKLLIFATLRDQAGTRTAELDVPAGTTVHALKERLAEQFPAMQRALGHALVSVNREYARDDAVLPDDAEVALFPPVSGG